MVENTNPLHPGEVLYKEFMEPANIDINKLAQALRINPRALQQLLGQQIGMNSHFAKRLSEYFTTTNEEYWFNLQTEYNHNFFVNNPVERNIIN